MGIRRPGPPFFPKSFLSFWLLGVQFLSFCWTGVSSPGENFLVFFFVSPKRLTQITPPGVRFSFCFWSMKKIVKFTWNRVTGGLHSSSDCFRRLDFPPTCRRSDCLVLSLVSIWGLSPAAVFFFCVWLFFVGPSPLSPGTKIGMHVETSLSQPFLVLKPCCSCQTFSPANFAENFDFFNPFSFFGFFFLCLKTGPPSFRPSFAPWAFYFFDRS